MARRLRPARLPRRVPTVATTFGAECFIYGTREILHRFMLRRLPCLAALAAGLVAPALAEEAVWQEVGRQGMTRFVIVPLAQARDREAYTRQIEQLCAANQSCFINFFTNASGAELAMPLPDAVTAEATAVFRRSTKQGAELFRWSCRLGLDPVNCF